MPKKQNCAKSLLASPKAELVQDAVTAATAWVEPSAEVIVAFQAADAPNNSITEAGIDDFSVEEVICGVDCPTDVNSDGMTDFGDVLAVLSDWGGVDADIDGDGTTGFSDLVVLLSAFGPC